MGNEDNSVNFSFASEYNSNLDLYFNNSNTAVQFNSQDQRILKKKTNLLSVNQKNCEMVQLHDNLQYQNIILLRNNQTGFFSIEKETSSKYLLKVSNHKNSINITESNKKIKCLKGKFIDDMFSPSVANLLGQKLVKHKRDEKKL